MTLKAGDRVAYRTKELFGPKADHETNPRGARLLGTVTLIPCSGKTAWVKLDALPLQRLFKISDLEKVKE